VRPDQLLALAVAAFEVYNSAVIVWELEKPGSTVCAKCALTRLALGAAVAGVGLVLAFGPSLEQ
jgi:hypothetical protein